jgi:peptidase M48-like protein
VVGDGRTRSADPRRVFRLVAVLGTGGVLAAAASVGAAIGSIHHASAASPRLELLGLPFTYPRLNGAEWLLLALALLGAVVITTALRACLRQRAAYREFLARLQVVGELAGQTEVKVIADRRPQAFCAGYLRPAVYVSRRALDLLTKDELDAVVAHERHSRLIRDPLRLASGRVLSQALFFVPLLRRLCERYADLAELSADRAAVLASAGREAPLASALLVFDENAPPGVSGISPQRVDSLLGHPISWSVPWWMLPASLGAVSSLSLMIWLTSNLASVQATFNLPFLSSRPCLVMLAMLPLLGGVTVARRLAATRRPI